MPSIPKAAKHLASPVSRQSQTAEILDSKNAVVLAPTKYKQRVCRDPQQRPAPGVHTHLGLASVSGFWAERRGRGPCRPAVDGSARENAGGRPSLRRRRQTSRTASPPARPSPAAPQPALPPSRKPSPSRRRPSRTRPAPAQPPPAALRSRPAPGRRAMGHPGRREAGAEARREVGKGTREGRAGAPPPPSTVTVCGRGACRAWEHLRGAAGPGVEVEGACGLGEREEAAGG